ncbi:hypothetical protein CC80DRAFT_497146 [Byssothecium circinans]|uniref:Flavin reductase like domain-containing protein n=1 Tax=Byssothecium circinans TaxID=147558 RepID=A0A6A5TE29_9PLEO|nr:hypothetical protein CC80DRAFT_497146 [Byssothecium circinans]
MSSHVQDCCLSSFEYHLPVCLPSPTCCILSSGTRWSLRLDCPSYHCRPHQTSANSSHKACVVPRPIGWVSTLSRDGVANLAPYSQFNNLTFDPPYVMFSANLKPSATQKDSVRNAEATGVFCWNLATWDLREAVNATSEHFSASIDEFAQAGLETRDSTLPELEITLTGGEKRRVPMVKKSPIQFECVHYTTLRLPGNPPMGAAEVVIGRVIGIHIDDGVLTEGKIDVRKTVPIARCGYFEYAAVRETFEMPPPINDLAMQVGLEGSTKGHRALEVQKDEGDEGDGK